MKSLTTLFLFSLFVTFMGISIVPADSKGGRNGKSPETIVSCVDGHVHTRSVPASIDESQCVSNPLCVICIRSLENQGCGIIDTTVSNNSTAVTSDGGQNITVDQDEIVTYLLSCVKP